MMMMPDKVSDDDDDGYERPKPLWRFRCCPPVNDKCIEDWSSFPLEVSYSNLNHEGHDLCTYCILEKICHHGAPKCATALLSHKAGPTMNLNITDCYGNYPLNAAAMSLSADLVKILLDHGVICECPCWRPVIGLGQNIYPLDYAVESLSCDKSLINWSLKKSVSKLIITLCLPQMREARETISLLAGVATSHTLSYTIYNAVKGQFVAVAALLLVARDKVLGLSFSGCTFTTGPVLFPKAILNELTALINQKYALMGKKTTR